jgi:DNA replication protein DnaC
MPFNFRLLIHYRLATKQKLLGTLTKHELWRHALERGRGGDWTVATLKMESQARNYIRDENKPARVTTREILEREYKIVSMAHDGISGFWPFAADFTPQGLAEDQKRAVDHILNSRNFVTLFRGGAGTGKSFALRAVNEGLTKAGHAVVVLTPQRQQAIDLSKAGFTTTQTVSEFMARKEMPHRAVVLVDESGQISAKQMLELLEFIQANEGRVILSGDTRQHGAVEASDALRAIEKYSGIVPAELKEIRRQNPALGKTAGQQSWIKEYRAAVAEAQAGNLAASFDRLDRLGAVIECPDQTGRLAAHFLELAIKNHSVVVVSQTWDEINRLNDGIRTQLRSSGLLGQSELLRRNYRRGINHPVAPNY